MRIMTDEQLAEWAAELAMSWISPTTPLSQTQGWKLVALQHSGSGHMEMYAWEKVTTWERELAETLATADDTQEGRDCIARAKERAVTRMRDLFLDGIRSAENPRTHWGTQHRVDPRAELREFISGNG
jgi:hypothetical protein